MDEISGIKQELDEITKVIADTVPVESIYLFGSYAYGAPNKDSENIIDNRMGLCYFVSNKTYLYINQMVRFGGKK